MPTETFLALASFAFVASFTPGPNNIMLTASGANFGFVRTIPHMIGVEIGFIVLLIACGAGLGAVLAAFPAMQTVLKVAGALYLLWLAWKVANAGATAETDAAAGKPLTFLQAAAFQWINPKGVVAALGAIAVFVRPEHAITDLLILVGVFAVSTLGSIAAWSGFGIALSGLLRDAGRARRFNMVMALLLVASIIPMVL
jgi:threonine/homoserine/homoserine lactone efflux protein